MSDIRNLSMSSEVAWGRSELRVSSIRPKWAEFDRWLADALDLRERNGDAPAMDHLLRALENLTSRADVWGSPRFGGYGGYDHQELTKAMLEALEATEKERHVTRNRALSPSQRLTNSSSLDSDSRPFEVFPEDRGRLRAFRCAERVFNMLELVVPKRVAVEEIGDALERIGRLLRESSVVWPTYVKAVSTVFWISINAVREISGAILGRKRA